ncbi:MAG: hypothetical protein IT189_10015 [Microbacteriaceae bacterium]|jgi:hypothetical protein|nr:hypothetical protein [Microbacteriaceae bacterium]
MSNYMNSLLIGVAIAVGGIVVTVFRGWVFTWLRTLNERGGMRVPYAKDGPRAILGIAMVAILLGVVLVATSLLGLSSPSP